MPHFSIQMTHVGPVLDVLIGLSTSRANAIRLSGVEMPPVQSVRMLVDTGAEGTCLDPSVLKALHLTPTGIIDVHTSTTGNNPVRSRQYDVSLRIVPASGTPLLIEHLAVSEHEFFASHNIHGLLGRDFLKQSFFSYNGQTRSFTFAYEITAHVRFRTARRTIRRNTVATQHRLPVFSRQSCVYKNLAP